jgi:type IV secretion system protein VirB3
MSFRKDPLFKGCTRPAMLFGVPLVPLGIVVSVGILLAVYIKLLLIIAMVPVIFMMRLITQTDDQQFRLLGLKLQLRFVKANRNGKFWGASTYSPLTLSKRRLD